MNDDNLLEELINENPVLRDTFKDYLSKTYGTGISIKLKPGQSPYLYYESGQHMFCYTPHRCEKGYFYAFDYVPVGSGSRSGNATKWKLKNMVKFRKRKLAKERALQRLKNYEGSVV